MSTAAASKDPGGYFPNWKEKTSGIIMPEERLPWIAAKLFGPRRVLLEHVAQYEHFNPEGTIRARLHYYFGLLHKIEGKSHLAREHFQKAFALARLEQATGLANKVAEDLKRCA
jgi:hypothetical protein